MVVLLCCLLQWETVFTEKFEDIPDITGKYPGWEQVVNDEFPFYNTGSVFNEGFKSSQSLKLTSLGGKVKFAKELKFTKTGYITVRARSRHQKGKNFHTYTELAFAKDSQTLMSYASTPRTTKSKKKWLSHEINTTTPPNFNKIIVSVILDPKNVSAIALFDEVTIIYAPRLNVTTETGNYLMAEHPNPLKFRIDNFDPGKKYEMTITDGLTGQKNTTVLTEADAAVLLEPGYYKIRIAELPGTSKLYISEAIVYKSIVSRRSKMGFSINPVKHPYSTFAIFSRFAPMMVKATIVDDEAVDMATSGRIQEQLAGTKVLYAISNPSATWEDLVDDQRLADMVKNINPQVIAISDEFTKVFPTVSMADHIARALGKGLKIAAPASLGMKQDMTLSTSPDADADFIVLNANFDFSTGISQALRTFAESFMMRPGKTHLLSLDSKDPIQFGNGYFYPAWQVLLYNTLAFLKSAKEITRLDNFTLPGVHGYAFKTGDGYTLLLWNDRYDEIPLKIGDSQKTTDIFMREMKKITRSMYPFLLHGISGEKLDLIKTVKVNLADKYTADIDLKRVAQKIEVDLPNVYKIRGSSASELDGLPAGVTVTESSTQVTADSVKAVFTVTISESTIPQESVVTVRTTYRDGAELKTIELPLLLRITSLIDLKVSSKKQKDNHALMISVTNNAKQVLNLTMKIMIPGNPIHKETIRVAPLETGSIKLLYKSLSGSQIRVSVIDYTSGVFSNFSATIK